MWMSYKYLPLIILQVTCTTSYVEFDTTNYVPATRCGQNLASRYISCGDI